MKNLKLGFVPKVCDTKNTYLMKKDKRRDILTTRFDHVQGKQRSGATETVASDPMDPNSDVSVGRSKTPRFV